MRALHVNQGGTTRGVQGRWQKAEQASMEDGGMPHARKVPERRRGACGMEDPVVRGGA